MASTAGAFRGVERAGLGLEIGVRTVVSGRRIPAVTRTTTERSVQAGRSGRLAGVACSVDTRFCRRRWQWLAHEKCDPHNRAQTRGDRQDRCKENRGRDSRSGRMHNERLTARLELRYRLTAE